ncbi:protein argonaute-2-like isoform X2 [Anoplolepis gracilipes]|uniref:protein argonaute-2-like isoform X2 n=1 Tax=Anoplolepis gracilipes TaxID=354296 RepID=UPI003BA177FC
MRENKIINYINKYLICIGYRHFSLLYFYCYAPVKRIAEMEVGILTQCVKLKTFKNSNYSVFKNILLKINSKLNGVNHTLESVPHCLKDCMLVGADVTHPSPGEEEIPFIAAR